MSNSNKLSYTYQTTVTPPSGPTVTTNHSGIAGYAALSTSAGNVYYLTDSSTSTSFNGWHGYQGSPGTTQSQAQHYLSNNLYICSSGCSSNRGASSSAKGLTITLNGGASLHIGTSPNSYRQPDWDTGYFLGTPDTSGITIQFGVPNLTNNTCIGCIKDLAFYWGSIDPGNEIIFTDWNSTPSHPITTTFYGGSFYNNTSNPNNYGNITSLKNLNNTASYAFDFSTTTAWQSVTFASCNYSYSAAADTFTPNCANNRAAFEFDNLEWKYPASCCSFQTQALGFASASVPEPAVLPGLGVGLAAMLGWLRRKSIAAQR